MHLSHLGLFLQCLLPCIVQLFEEDSAVVHWVRAYQHVRMLLGFDTNAETRLDSLIKRLVELNDLTEAIQVGNIVPYSFGVVGYFVEAMRVEKSQALIILTYC